MPPRSLEGQTLGKYRVMEPLGRGGMAQVYRAYHPQLDRYVAVKVLRWDLLDEEEFLERFRREAQAVAALRHPNIVQVFDFDVQDDLTYMVMELLEGDTLKARLNDYRVRDEKMPLGEVVRILLDVLDGLAYAHSEGMIHRDIKPANVMLTKRGQAVLGDFGIAQIVGGTRHTAPGVLMGTLNYIAPEQGLEGRSDARSDIYSLGIVLYEMLTGRPPFDADTPLAILMKHVNDPLPLPRRIDPDIPESLERVVLKALAKQADDRYQAAVEVAEALRRAAAEAEIELPTRISLPLSFTTVEAPSESVAVLSGTAREKLVDVEFSADDTDDSLARRLEAERAAREAAQRDAPAEAAAPAAPDAQERRGQAEAHFQAVVAAPAPAERPARPLSRAILTALAIVAGGNVAAVMAAAFTGLWGIYRVGWPMELLLVGLGLCVILEATGSAALLALTGMVLGNGVLFSYYSITRWWSLWSYLWPLEPLVVAGSIVLAVRLARQGEGSREVIRSLAERTRRVTLFVLAGVLVLSAIFGMLR